MKKKKIMKKKTKKKKRRRNKEEIREMKSRVMIIRILCLLITSMSMKTWLVIERKEVIGEAS